MSYNYSKEHLLEIECHKKYVTNATDCIVEIGVLEGATTKQLLKFTSAEVYGIDPIIVDSMSMSLIGNLNKINDLTKEYKNFKFIQDYSFNVVKSWNKPIDYLFIDGDHNYEAVKRDAADWYPHVKRGGYISFHDSAANRGGPACWSGPSQLTDEIIKNNKKLKYIETVWSLTVFQKI